jgi:hypothetical protein
VTIKGQKADFFIFDEVPTDFSQRSLKEFQFSLCERKHIESFIEEWHYSHNVNGLMHDYCFKVDIDDVLVGAMIYGSIAMAGVWEKYAEQPQDLIELRRLCCVDLTPKNLESRFIAYTLRWLRKHTQIKTVISYSDLEYGHEGTIYKASNFKYGGQTSPGRVIMYKGKRYHDKTIRTKYKDELKPFAQEIKNALESGEAFYKETKAKNVWLYTL